MTGRLAAAPRASMGAGAPSTPIVTKEAAKKWSGALWVESEFDAVAADGKLTIVQWRALVAEHLPDGTAPPSPAKPSGVPANTAANRAQSNKDHMNSLFDHEQAKPFARPAGVPGKKKGPGKQVKSVDRSHAKIGDDGAQELAQQQLKGNRSLLTLRLDDNDLTWQGVQWLACVGRRRDFTRPPSKFALRCVGFLLLSPFAPSPSFLPHGDPPQSIPT